MSYSVALQRAIEHHCRGVFVPKEIAEECPYHAKLLNETAHACCGCFAVKTWRDKYMKAEARVKSLEDAQWFLRPVPEEDVGGVTWKQECLDVKEQLSKHLSTAIVSKQTGKL